MATQKKTRGFTLLELLLVVAIVSILGALSAPLFNEYKRNANDASARTDTANAAHQIISAMK